MLTRRTMLGALGAVAAGAQAPVAVPLEYQALYADLDRALDASLQKIGARWDGKRRDVAFGGGALYSNSNSGQVLLSREARDLGSMFLRQLRSLGLTSISFDINYPMLCAAFHGNSATLDGYAAYYRSVISEARELGFRVEIESATIFREPEYSSVPVEGFYSGLTWEEFLRTRMETLVLIVEELKPDYLTICNEPDTEARNTGMPVLERYSEMVRHLVRNLAPRSARNGVLLGAGFGLWLPDYASRARELLDTASLSFLNVHSYPVLNDLIDRVEELRRQTEPRGVMMGLGETWLYKTGAGAAFENHVEVFARDSYSFWAPLDQKHLRLWHAIANWADFLFVAPFWTRYFLAYVEHDSRTGGMAAGALLALAQQRATQALLSGETTSTARVYSELIGSQRPEAMGVAESRLPR